MVLQDFNSIGFFCWFSGDEVMYIYWNWDQFGYSCGGCVVLVIGSVMGLWEVKNCIFFWVCYICWQSLGILVMLELFGLDFMFSFIGFCFQGWVLDFKFWYCYKVFSFEWLQDKKSWVQVQGVCQELGVQLLSLVSYEEEYFVVNMFNKIFGELEFEIYEQYWFWIGLNCWDFRGGQSWCWSDGLGFFYYNFDWSWYDDDDIWGCVVLDLVFLQWVVMQCDIQLDWICKIFRGIDVWEFDDSF